MENEFRTTINVTRKQICDLILACHAASEMSGGAEKWSELRNNLKQQLADLDEQLDSI